MTADYRNQMYDDPNNSAHTEWFKREYPGTYADARAGEMGAEVIFAHSLCAWQEVERRRPDIQPFLD